MDNTVSKSTILGTAFKWPIKKCGESNEFEYHYNCILWVIISDSNKATDRGSGRLAELVGWRGFTLYILHTFVCLAVIPYSYILYHIICFI